MGRVYDVIVIGATVSGLTSAIALARRGVKVVVLDPNRSYDSASVGHGVATVCVGDLIRLAQDSLADLERHLNAIQGAMAYIEQTAAANEVPYSLLNVEERSAKHLDVLANERGLLREVGIETIPEMRQPLPGLELTAGWSVPNQIIVKPEDYALALHAEAEQAGVTVLHEVTLTRFRRHQVLHAVHYRSQLVWEQSMNSDWAPRVIDTQAVSPWGRHAIIGEPLFAPVALGQGLNLSRVLSLRDTPARLIRPWDDGVLVTGHPVPMDAAETAAVGLRQWLRERLGVEITAMTGFGIEPATAEPFEGAAVIPGGFWAGGNGLWELGAGTAAGLALADRLLAKNGSQQRLPVLSRLRARFTRSQK